MGSSGQIATTGVASSRGSGSGLPLKRRPSLIVHADWGTKPKKRWAARASLESGRYTISKPAVVASAAALLSEAVAAADSGGSVLVGFDFAFGVPVEFLGERSGKHFLELIANCRPAFFEAVKTAREVSSQRPFLGVASRGDKLVDVLAELGLSPTNHLRRCERRTPYRGDARCIFWPGAGQVAGATRSGWREILRPALDSSARSQGLIRIWPFDGQLEQLVQSGTVVLAETYPAEFYGHLGMSGRSKTKLGWRLEHASHLIRAATEMGLALEPNIQSDIRGGFGHRSDGEDRFDATAGLLGMLRVVAGLSPTVCPDEKAVRQIEGWILGRPP